MWVHNQLHGAEPFLEKTIVHHLVKNIAAVCGTRMFFTVLIGARHCSLCWARWTQSILFLSLKINFNITLPLTPRSSKRAIPFRLSHRNLVCIFLLPYTYHKPHPSRWYTKTETEFNTVVGFQIIPIRFTATTILCEITSRLMRLRDWNSWRIVCLTINFKHHISRLWWLRQCLDRVASGRTENKTHSLLDMKHEC